MYQCISTIASRQLTGWWKPIHLRINPHSGVPIYVQIVQQVKTAIAGGTLAPGERLPAVRDLALALTINPNTVARAYQELERSGLVHSRAGRGTFVAARGRATLSPQDRARRLEAAVQGLLTEARALGFSVDDVHRLLARPRERPAPGPDSQAQGPGSKDGAGKDKPGRDNPGKDGGGGAG